MGILLIRNLPLLSSMLVQGVLKLSNLFIKSTKEAAKEDADMINEDEDEDEDDSDKEEEDEQ